MATSLGVDIEEVGRFRRLIRNKNFLNRVFTREEIAYCRSKKNQAQHFAVRFSAKEAIWKALSERLLKRKLMVAHKEIGIRNAETGKPEVVLPRALAPLRKKIVVSLSHTNDYAVAVALLEG